VYPRTKSLEQVQGEYDTQLKGGVTRTDEAVKAGEAENPSYALSVISRKIGTGNRFNATVIDLEEGVGIDGDTAPYTSLSEGMYAMESLAATLSASVVSEEEPFGKIAILPFSGGTQGEREGIPELLSFTMMRDFSVIPRTSITDAARQEQSFQATSGMTNADTIARLGNQLGADYVLAGSITSLGSKNLLIVSIVRIDVIRQVAGVYLTYDSLDELNNDETILKNMAEGLVKMARNATDGLDKLALLPVELADGGSREEGDTLAQILAIHLLRAGKYAVYPRTKSLEQVQGESDTQLKGGVTRTDEAVKAWEAENPSYALSVISRKIGTGTRFNASIIDLEGGYTVMAKSEQYTRLSDGMYAMEFLARELSGGEVTARQREERLRMVEAETEDEDQTERARARAEATDKFLKNSGIILGGWAGMSVGGSRVSAGGSTIDAFRGGAIIELRPYDNLIGIQTGVNVIADNMPYPGRDGEFAKLTTVQLPILFRFNLRGQRERNNTKIRLMAFGGVGLNLFAGASDAVSVDPVPLSVIAGGGLEWYGYQFSLALMYQYNGDIGGSSLTAGGISHEYTRNSHLMGIVLTWYIRFRKDQ
jgi:TolB-like protein